MEWALRINSRDPIVWDQQLFISKIGGHTLVDKLSAKHFHFYINISIIQFDLDIRKPTPLFEHKIVIKVKNMTEYHWLSNSAKGIFFLERLQMLQIFKNHLYFESF